MPQYKCIPAPEELIISENISFTTAVNSYADIINRETTDGWYFYSMENVAFKKKSSRSRFFKGRSKIPEFLNMLVFVKD